MPAGFRNVPAIGLAGFVSENWRGSQVHELERKRVGAEEPDDKGPVAGCRTVLVVGFGLRARDGADSGHRAVRAREVELLSRIVVELIAFAARQREVGERGPVVGEPLLEHELDRPISALQATVA